MTLPEASLPRVAGLLGGRKILGNVSEPAQMVDAVRRGLPYAAFEALSVALDAAQHEMTSVIGVAPRTLARRKHQRHLSPLESDRLYRVAHVTDLAAQVLGDLTKARLWLHRPNRALGAKSPLSLLDTEIGGRQVSDALLRISHGIYA